MILWEGKSLINGEPIVAILTEKSKNRKITGPGEEMAQLWILPQAYPMEAKEAVCGKCPFVKKGCYVLPFSYLGVWKKWKRGGHEPLDLDRLEEITDGRMVRLGAWGDPAAVPAKVLSRVIQHAKGWTGYTHQWAEPRVYGYRAMLMASVETPGMAQLAQDLGWRTFRVGLEAPGPMEFRCPASEEAGKLSTCARCGLCNGASGITQKSVVIEPHGPQRWKALREKEQLALFREGV